MNYNIARCSIKWCENANKRHIIIFNHMQQFYYLICQSTWCQNASKLIYQKGEISFLWDTKIVVYFKLNFHAWRWTGRWQKSSGLENRPTPGMFFPKHPVFHFAPMFHFAPTYYIGLAVGNKLGTRNSRLQLSLSKPGPSFTNMDWLWSQRRSINVWSVTTLCWTGLEAYKKEKTTPPFQRLCSRHDPCRDLS